MHRRLIILLFLLWGIVFWRSCAFLVLGRRRFRWGLMMVMIKGARSRCERIRILGEQLAYSKTFRMLGIAPCPTYHIFLYCSIDI